MHGALMICWILIDPPDTNILLRIFLYRCSVVDTTLR